MTDQNQTTKTLDKTYDPASVEQNLSKFWIDGGYFSPTVDPTKEPFVIIMPPPNVTGQLHLGHALQATIADIMVRWHRMKGDPTLWLPGADHAGIATQVVVERTLAQENLTRQIAEAIQEVTRAAGVAVVIEAKHMCMMMRGVQKQNSEMVTSCLLGSFRDNPQTRSEFLSLVHR